MNKVKITVNGIEVEIALTPEQSILFIPKKIYDNEILELASILSENYCEGRTCPQDVPDSIEKCNLCRAEYLHARGYGKIDRIRLREQEEEIAMLKEAKTKAEEDSHAAMLQRLHLWPKIIRLTESTGIWSAENVIKLIEKEVNTEYNRKFYLRILAHAGYIQEEYHKVRKKIIEYFGGNNETETNFNKETAD